MRKKFAKMKLNFIYKWSFDHGFRLTIILAGLNFILMCHPLNFISAVGFGIAWISFTLSALIDII